MLCEEIGTIWTFETDKFRVIVDAIEEGTDPRDSFDEEQEAPYGTFDKIERGLLLWFTARARVVMFDGTQLAVDCLGGCCYESLEAFRDHWAPCRYRAEIKKRFLQVRESLRWIRERGYCVEARWLAEMADIRREFARYQPNGRCGSYFSDMVREVCREARAKLGRLKSIPTRDAA